MNRRNRSMRPHFDKNLRQYEYEWPPYDDWDRFTRSSRLGYHMGDWRYDQPAHFDEARLPAGSPRIGRDAND